MTMLPLFQDPATQDAPEFPFRLICTGCDSILGVVESAAHGGQLLTLTLDHVLACAGAADGYRREAVTG